MAIYRNKEELLGTDWQEKINQAAALGDWQAAAQYEQARNEKIASPEYTGSQTATYRYAQYLPEEGTAPSAAVTGGTVRVPEAVQSGALPSFDDSDLQAAKPGWSSGYADRIETLLTELEKLEPFRYDPESDPLYRQYREQYRREGARAVDDTLAAAASHAGGMNSYAVTAAQQAGDYYNAQLMERIPELAQLAYEMYLGDYGRDLDRLELLRDQEAEDYSRYQDDLADWYAQLEAAYQQHRDSVADSKWRESFDYEQARDAEADRKWQQEFAHNAAQDSVANRQWQQMFDYEKERDSVSDSQWRESFDHQQAQDAIDNAYRQEVFDYEKGLDAVQQAPAVPAERDRDTDGRTYDNGSLTREQVAELQNYYEVEADGLWGRDSTAAAGGQTAEQAWEEYQRMAYPAARTTGVGYDPESGVYRWNGEAYADLAALESGINSAGLTAAELEEVMRQLSALGIGVERVK